MVMNMYDGKIKQNDISPKLKGLENAKTLSCEIKKVEPLGNLTAAMRDVGKMSGKFEKNPLFGGIVKPFSIRHSFFESAKQFAVGHFVRLRAWHTNDARADKAVKTGKTASIVGVTSADVSAEHEFKASKTARLVAYFRSPVNFVRNLMVALNVNVKTGFGADLDCENKVNVAVKDAIENASGAVVNGSRNVQFFKHLDILMAKSGSAETTLGFQSVHDVKAKTATVTNAETNILANVKHYARLIAWGNAVVDGVLIIRNAYEATQDGELLFMGTVPETWDEPYYDESGALIIEQVRVAEKSGEVLGVI